MRPCTDWNVDSWRCAAVSRAAVAGLGWADLRTMALKKGETWVPPLRDRPATLRFEGGRDAAGTRVRLGESVIVAAGFRSAARRPASKSVCHREFCSDR
jgi:hypothetical protein